MSSDRLAASYAATENTRRPLGGARCFAHVAEGRRMALTSSYEVSERFLHVSKGVPDV